MNYDPDAFGDDPTPEPSIHDMIRDASHKIIKAERRVRRLKRKLGELVNGDKGRLN